MPCARTELPDRSALMTLRTARRNVVPVNYTPRLQNLLHHAERIAQEHGHNHVRAEHLILGLLAEPDGIAGQVLKRLRVMTNVAAMTEEIMASASYRTTSSRKMTP